MVDIGGRSLHVVQTDGDGPVVALEAGDGGFSSFWLRIQPRLQDEFGLRTISYDRAGFILSSTGQRRLPLAMGKADIHG